GQPRPARSTRAPRTGGDHPLPGAEALPGGDAARARARDRAAGPDPCSARRPRTPDRRRPGVRKPGRSPRARLPARDAARLRPPERAARRLRESAARGLPVGPRPRRAILSALENRAAFVSEEGGGPALPPMPDATDAVRGPPPAPSSRVDRW